MKVWTRNARRTGGRWLGLSAALAAAVGATGCHGSGSGTPAIVDGGLDGADSAPPPPIVSAACADPTASVVITDDTNYTLSDQFTIQLVTLRDNTDLVFDWSRLTTDFFGKPVNPATDINLVLLALWSLTPDQIEADLKVDNIPLSANAGIITSYPDGTYTSKDLFDFNLLGQPLPMDQVSMFFDTSTPNYAYPQNQYTFMAMASTGTTPGKGARAIALFHIDPSATTTELDLTNDSTKLDYSVNLLRAAPVLVPAAVAALTLDWSQMTVNMLGNPYIASQITQVAVAHYATATLPDLQRQFLDLQDIADGWWSGPVVSGASIGLGALVDAGGATFPGIDSSGVWLAALFCGNCNNPAPWSITILEPCP
jgi:hypothetical protein